MAKLTDNQRKMIVADYAETGNKSAVARKHGVSDTTVANVIKLEPDALKMLEQKKEENTQDVLAYLDEKASSIKRLGDYILDERLNPSVNKEELSATSIRELVVAFGTMTDKMLKSKEIQARSKDSAREIEDIAAIRRAVFGVNPDKNA